MDNENKARALLGHVAMAIFMAGTFIPLSAAQKARQKIPVDDLGLWNFHVATAICLFLFAIIVLDIGFTWLWMRILGYFWVIGSVAWLFREISSTAEQFSWVNVIIGLVTLILLTIQYKNRK